MHYCDAPHSFRGPLRPWGDPIVIVLKYFDGETDGLLRCGVCGQTYQFRLVAWDEGREERVFALSRLAQDIYEKVLRELMKYYGEATSRYWVPGNPSLDDATRAAVHAETVHLLADSFEPEAVLMTEQFDQEVLSLEILQGRSIEGMNWWARLG